MMRLRNVVTGAVLTATVCLCSTSARADLDPAVRQDPNPAEPPIRAYVKQLIEQINKSDAKSAQAREELCRQAESTDRLAVSAGFQSVYVRVVRSEIAGMLKDKDIPKRLNAAIVIYRLANATKIGDLQTEAVLLCGDESPAIALWGVKAAGALMPSVMAIGMNIPRQQLTPAILKAAQTHLGSGAIVQDAYVALDLSGVTPAVPPAALNAATTAMLDLLRLRINAAIDHMPSSPQADWAATRYFPTTAVFGPAPAPQKVQIVQGMLDLASVCAQRAAQTSVKEESDRLVDIATLCGGAMKVFLLSAKNEEGAKQLDKVIKARSVPVAQLDGLIRSVVPTLQSAFNGVIDPPKVKPLPQPTTAP